MKLRYIWIISLLCILSLGLFGAEGKSSVNIIYSVNKDETSGRILQMFLSDFIQLRQNHYNIYFYTDDKRIPWEKGDKPVDFTEFYEYFPEFTIQQALDNFVAYKSKPQVENEKIVIISNRFDELTDYESEQSIGMLNYLNTYQIGIHTLCPNDTTYLPAYFLSNFTGGQTFEVGQYTINQQLEALITSLEDDSEQPIIAPYYYMRPFGLIISVKDGWQFTNLTTADFLEEGMLLNVYKVESLLAEEFGKSLNIYDERFIGKLWITDANRNFSKGKMLTESKLEEPEKGDIVKIPHEYLQLKQRELQEDYLRHMMNAKYKTDEYYNLKDSLSRKDIVLIDTVTVVKYRQELFTYLADIEKFDGKELTIKKIEGLEPNKIYSIRKIPETTMHPDTYEDVKIGDEFVVRAKLVKNYTNYSKFLILSENIRMDLVPGDQIVLAVRKKVRVEE